MLLLGLDIGTSAVKATVVESGTGAILASATYPEKEAAIIALQPGWAEQDPETWWTYVQSAILKCNSRQNYDPAAIGAIGIAYQMHGLVLVDKAGSVLRNSIIWCDSRAVELGNKAFETIGREACLGCLLNSPGNFTAGKLAWVKENEPGLYEKVYKAMLPGDFIAFKLTGAITTSVSALSEGIFWDFKNNEVSKSVMDHYGFDETILPDIHPLFSSHGELSAEVARQLSLRRGIPVTYKAGDQPNNALSLNVLQPGEVAATAGTSGVIYGVTDKLAYDQQSRINSFAHVNHGAVNGEPRIGVLLCINGTGIFYKWAREMFGQGQGYEALNAAAASVPPGANGLLAIPYGNGAERMLNNQQPGAQFHGIDLNLHKMPHFMRSVQEGIAFSFRYGLDIMRQNGMHPSLIRASKANMFLSEVFTQAFADVTGLEIEFYEGDGSYGAAIGAGIGAGLFTQQDAFSNRKAIARVKPQQQALYNGLYEKWLGVQEDNNRQ